MICNPEAVVMAFPGVCAIAAVGIETTDAVRTVNAMAAKVENVARMLAYPFRSIGRLSIVTSRAKPASIRLAHAGLTLLIAEGAAVLARIGATGQRSLVPVDPDRLAAAERRNDLCRLMSELLQARDDFRWHAILELIDAFVMQAARHIDRFLHVASIVLDVGQHVGLADRLILTTHDAVRHDRAAALGRQRRHDRMQRALARRDAVRMAD